MIEFDKAFEIVMDCARRLGTEQVDITNALNRILAQDVVSDIEMPPFDKSAMDGYACRRSDLAKELTIVETIPAGMLPKETVGPNQCSKIMTGAVLPKGADCVIMVEHTDQTSQSTIRFTGSETADNICLKGEDIKTGAIMLNSGTLIKPEHIAVLASVGCVKPLVSCRPRVGVIATGNELVEPQIIPNSSQIRNSNSYQLTAQLTEAGAIATYYGIAADTENSIDSTLKKAIAQSDVVLLAGGVSMGDFDLVPGVLKENGIELLFEKVAIKPGRPTVFGISDEVFCFGLPGNPVSTFVIFEILVKPFLYKMAGYDFKPVIIPMPLAKKISRRRTERISWLPVIFTDNGTVTPVEYHGSAHINALCGADGLISIPIGIDEIKEGTTVNVRQI